MKHGYRKHLMERWSVGALERAMIMSFPVGG